MGLPYALEDVWLHLWPLPTRSQQWEIDDILKISKPIINGGNEQRVFYFTEKNITDFLANPIQLSEGMLFN